MVNAQDLMKTDFIITGLEDSVSSVIGLMERHEECYAIVMDKTNYLGVASKKWLLSSKIDTANMRVRNLVKQRSKNKTQFFVPKLSPNTELREMARLMTTADMHALPVIIKEGGKEKVIGMVHALDILAALRMYYSRVRADEIGSMKLITVHEDDALSKAINLMTRQGIGHVVVVDAKNKLIGVIGLTDVLTDVHAFPRQKMHIPRAASHQDGKHTGFGIGEKTACLKLPVRNIITNLQNCVTAMPEESMAHIIDLMVNNEVSSVILVKKDIPVGIIAIKDILEDFGKA